MSNCKTTNQATLHLQVIRLSYLKAAKDTTSVDNDAGVFATHSISWIIVSIISRLFTSQTPKDKLDTKRKVRHKKKYPEINIPGIRQDEEDTELSQLGRDTSIFYIIKFLRNRCSESYSRTEILRRCLRFFPFISRPNFRKEYEFDVNT